MKNTVISLKTNKGFSTIEFVISFMLNLFIFILLVIMLKMLLKVNLIDEKIQDDIKTIQLKQDLALAYNIELKENIINYEYNSKNYQLYFVNGHLIKGPGSQIVYENIDNCIFKIEGNNLLISFKRGNKIYEKIFKIS